MLPRRLHFYNNEPFSDTAKHILSDTIGRLNEEVNDCFRYVRKSLNKLESTMTTLNLNQYDAFAKLINHCFNINRNVIRKTDVELNQKFDVIFRSSPWVTYSNSDNVVNMSSVPLTMEQLCVLGYGLSFALPPNSNSILDFLTNFSKFEYFNRNTNNPTDFNTLKGYLLNSIYREVKNNYLIPRRFKEAINYLQANDEIIICKADKGGKVVVMDRLTYDNKMNDLLQDSVTYKKLNSNPLKKWQRDFNQQIKSTLKDYPDLIRKFNAYMPRLPHIYGLPKIHKDNCPLRPIVSTIGSVNYSLSSWIAKLLTPQLNSISNCHLTNTTDFINKIKNVNLSNSTMISFDVISLFTNVPVAECIQLLETELNNRNFNLPVSNNVFIELIKLVTNSCFFSFNNCFYSQTAGLPMGNPVSPVLACLFLEFFERDILVNVLDVNNVTWKRYVDDIFAVVPSSTDIQSLLNRLNNLHNSIQFQYEIENNHTLPFLDVLLIKNALNNKPKFKVYRKPTHSNTYIHSFSNHSYGVKLGTMVGMFLRSYRICSPEFIDEEIQYLTNVFNSLGYHHRFIHKAHMKSRKSFYKPSNNTQNINPENNKQYLVLPPLSDNNLTQSLISDMNINIANKNTNTLRQMFNNYKTSSSTDSSTIYYIPCQSCSLGYIGESSDHERRLYQHKYDRRNLNTNNAIVNHTINTGHNINIDNNTVIHKVSNVNKRKLIESILINNTQNFNNHRNNYNFDFFSNSLIKQIPFISRMISLIQTHHHQYFINPD